MRKSLFSVVAALLMLVAPAGLAQYRLADSVPASLAWTEPAPAAANELSLRDGEVAVSCTWRNQYSGETGVCTPIPQTNDVGQFWFTSPSNAEVFAKVLDFGKDRPYLLFWGGLTDLEYSITYRQTQTGQAVTFRKEAFLLCGGANTSTLNHVAGAAPVISSFTASPAAISPGGSATLAWASTGGTSASIDPGVGTVQPSGSATVSPSQTTSYTLTVKGAGGTSTSSVTVSVNTPKVLPRILSFGQAAGACDGIFAVEWTTENGVSAVITPSVGAVPVNGKANVPKPSTRTWYTLTVTNSSGSVEGTAAVDPCHVARRGSEQRN